MKAVRHERPAALAALSFDDHATIEASAGTGKTYTLEHLFIELLLRGATVEQILVVTFTEKATAELRYRIRSKLEELVDPALPDAGPLPPERCWLLDDEARSKLAQAIQSFDAATIATIHSFCQRVLTDHAFANRRLFTQEQVDGRHAFTVAFKEALREEFARREEPQRYLRAALSRGMDVDQIEEQLYACHMAPGRLEPHYDPDALERALQGAAVADFEDPALKASLKAARVNARSIPAICDRLAALVPLLVRALDHRDLPRYLQEFEALSAASTYRENGLLSYPAEKLDGLDLDDLGTRVQRSVLQLRQATVPLVAALARIFLPAVRARLSRRKREAGLFDFDDMLSLVRENLYGPTGEPLTRALRQRYRFALIDEFQDTDETQWDIFRKIFFDSNRHNLMFLIGDPKQAIYGFRGADVHAYVRATRQIRAAGGAQVALEHNFRSSPALIDAYNEILDPRAPNPFFSGNVVRYEQPVQSGDPSPRIVDAEGNDLSSIHLLTLSARMSANDALRAVGRRIAQEILALVRDDAPLLFWHRKGRVRAVNLRDIFILTFSRREGLIAGECLRQAGVPHSFYKQDGLFDTDEAAHVLDLLTAIDDPHDPAKRLRAWLTPFFGLSLDDARRCREVPGDHPLMARLFTFHGLAREKRYERLFARILEETGVLRRALLLHGGERELTSYLHLFELLLEEVGRARCSVRELVFLLRSYIDGRRLPPGDNPGVQRLESDQPAVQIMTMHKSKGLEAAVVFVAGGFSKPRFSNLVESYHLEGERCSFLGRNRPEHVQKAIEREGREEDERLLYVALTRAMARLYLPYFPIKKGNWSPDGAYACVNERLHAMVEGGLSPRFSAEAIDLFPSTEPLSEAPPASIPAWASPEDAFLPHTTASRLAALRAGRGGRFMTSYTAMQKGYDHGGSEREADQTGEVAPMPERAEDELPGGAASGIFLHDVIEHTPFSSFERAASFDAWFALDEIRSLTENQARTHGIDPRYIPHAARLVHASLASPVDLGPFGTLDGVWRAERSAREVEFLFPLPTRSSPPQPPLPATRGEGEAPTPALHTVVGRGRQGDDGGRRGAPSSRRGRIRGGRASWSAPPSSRGDFSPAPASARGLEAAALPDSFRTSPPDSFRASPPDSVGAGPPDSVGASPPDSVGAGPPDSVGASPPDSVGASPPDSVGIELSPLHDGGEGAGVRGSPSPVFPERGPGGEDKTPPGFVKGYIDFLFEHRGRLFFADWKSDGLRAWGVASLEEHVKTSYPRQLQLYTLALLKMLGVRTEEEFEARFGGVLYVFLRGVARGNGEGLYFWRPGWPQVRAWQQDLELYTAQLRRGGSLCHRRFH